MALLLTAGDETKPIIFCLTTTYVKKSFHTIKGMLVKLNEPVNDVFIIEKMYSSIYARAENSRADPVFQVRSPEMTFITKNIFINTYIIVYTHKTFPNSIYIRRTIFTLIPDIKYICLLKML